MFRKEDGPSCNISCANLQVKWATLGDSKACNTRTPAKIATLTNSSFGHKPTEFRKENNWIDKNWKEEEKENKRNNRHFSCQLPRRERNDPAQRKRATHALLLHPIVSSHYRPFLVLLLELSRATTDVGIPCIRVVNGARERRKGAQRSVLVMSK